MQYDSLLQLIAFQNSAENLLTYFLKQFSFFFEQDIDAVSIVLALLAIITVEICNEQIQFISKQRRLCRFLLAWIEFFIIVAFTTDNFFTFYVCFEALLLPLIVMIGVWGSRKHRVRSAIYIFFYTLVGGISLLYALIQIVLHVGSTDIDSMAQLRNLDLQSQVSIFTLLMIGFAIKVPMVPWHTWLPEAHVESPTTGSIILAALILKLSGYGLFKFVLPFLPLAVTSYSQIIQLWAVFGIIHASFMAIQQLDIKRMIAYSSVAHMNMGIVGIFSLNLYGLAGGLYLIFGHGLVAAALFYSIGVMYDRYSTRSIADISGLMHLMPKLGKRFFILLLANFGFPSTCNFIGEFLILQGIYVQNIILAILVALTTVITLAYSIWLFNRTVYGNEKIAQTQVLNVDLTRVENTILTNQVLMVLGYGFLVFAMFETFLPIIQDLHAIYQ